MKLGEVVSTSPIETEKSVRGDEIRALTSCRAGHIVPVAYMPVLREDRVSKGNIRLSFKMAETIHPLMNSVNVTAYAHFIPFFAFERFTGMDAFNRSYQGKGEPHNNTPIPFFQTVAFDRQAAFWKTLGVHWPQGGAINSAPLEAYNLLVNWRRQVRSRHLPQRTLLDTTLAAAFWKHSDMYHIVPDFDQAAMDGEVQLQFANSTAPVRGIGFANPMTASGMVASPAVRQGNGVTTNFPISTSLSNTNNGKVWFKAKEGGGVYAPDVFTELADMGVTLSLANIELAKQTAAFAKLQEKYSALSDDHIIDLLMEGIRVPDEALKQPILLDKASTIFGYSERHAMDGANLDVSVTTGETSLDLRFRTPAMNTGGIVLITVEIVPEQLFERKFDQFLGTSNPDKLPNFLRDFLDPEKVEVVPNKYPDVMHSTPEGTFGYAPLNHAWKRSITRVGGKYYRPTPDAFVEDRQRFWSVEQLNPTLTADFYMVNSLPHSVFMDTISDAFEVLALGNMQVVGNTVFGKTLDEDTGDYEKIMSQVEQTRIKQGS